MAGGKRTRHRRPVAWAARGTLSASRRRQGSAVRRAEHKPSRRRQARAIQDQIRTGVARPRVHRRIGGREVGVQRDCAAIRERPAIAGVEIAFAGQSLGQQHVVRGKLHMVVRDRRHALLRDGGAVDEVAHRDQHAFDEHGMVGREQQITKRLAGGEGAGADAHRPDIVRARMQVAAQPPMAEPDHLGAAAAGEQHAVAGPQMLDRHVAGRRGDAGAGGEAGVGFEGIDVGLGASRQHDEIVGVRARREAQRGAVEEGEHAGAVAFFAAVEAFDEDRVRLA